MAESKMQVEINSVFDSEGKKNPNITIPLGLENSRVAEKFITSYIENMSTFRIEREQIKQLREQNNRKREEEVQKMFYTFLIIFFVAIAIGVFKGELFGSLIVGIVGLIGMGYITHIKMQLLNSQSTEFIEISNIK